VRVGPADQPEITHARGVADEKRTVVGFSRRDAAGWTNRQTESGQGSRRNCRGALSAGGTRANDLAGANRADQPVVGNPRPLGLVDVRAVGERQAQRIGVGNVLPAGHGVDIVLVGEPFEAPLDRVLALDVLHVSIELISISILGSVQAKARAATEVA